MGTGRRLVLAAVVAITSGAGMTACSDEPTPTVSQSDYREQAVVLCDRQGEEMNRSLDEFRSPSRSDAERVAGLRAEFIPRVRAIIRGINRNGYPADRAAEYSSALNDALVALDEIEDDTYVLIDRIRRDELPEDEDPFVALEAALLTADVPCA